MEKVSIGGEAGNLVRALRISRLDKGLRNESVCHPSARERRPYGLAAKESTNAHLGMSAAGRLIDFMSEATALTVANRSLDPGLQTLFSSRARIVLGIARISSRILTGSWTGLSTSRTT